MATATGTALPRGAGQRFGLAALLLLVAAVAGLVAAYALARDEARAPSRQIEVSVQDGKFDGSNPTLELTLGEKVAITVINREQGVVHDFLISGLGARTGYIKPGDRQAVIFTPKKAGLFRYICTLHPGSMDGQVIVRER